MDNLIDGELRALFRTNSLLVDYYNRNRSFHIELLSKAEVDLFCTNYVSCDFDFNESWVSNGAIIWFEWEWEPSYHPNSYNLMHSSKEFLNETSEDYSQDSLEYRDYMSQPRLTMSQILPHNNPLLHVPVQSQQ